MFSIRFVLFMMMAFIFSNVALANDAVIGSVDTSMNLLGSNDSIKVVTLNDPDIPSVHCYMSTAVSGDLGIASNKSEYDLSCFTTGVVTVSDSLAQQAQIVMEHRSAFFKQLRIVRIIDREHRRIVYLAYTTWFIDGSPKHAMSSVGY